MAEEPPDWDFDDFEVEDLQALAAQEEIALEAARERVRIRIAKKDRYIALGRTAITEMIDANGAAIWLEIVARAGDYPWRQLNTRIDPHHLRAALKQLLGEGTLTEVTERTRGGREVTVIVPVDTARRKRQVDDAAAKRRLVAARYLGWASGTASVPGIVGPAAQRVAHISLLTAAPYVGYRLLNPRNGETTTIRGHEISGGPVDNAAIFHVEGSPLEFLLVIEVKSLRPWMYPRDDKLYQLLFKAAALSARHPDLAIVPLLVCRKAHFTTFLMARDLGFHIVDTRLRQWLPEGASDDAALREVQDVLGYADIWFVSGLDDHLVRQFSQTLPRWATTRATRWARVGSRLIDHYEPLWLETGDDLARSARLNKLRDAVKELLSNLPTDLRDIGREGGW